MPSIEHSAIPDVGLHEIKGAATAAAGSVPVSDGVGGHAWEVQDRGTVIGFADYNDATTASTPISSTGGAGYTYLTNDEAGSFTNKTYLPTGVTDVWDAVNNKFDWTEMSLGDMVDIRVDLEVTTTAANQSYDLQLEMAIGGSNYNIQFIATEQKTAGVHKVNIYNGIYMGDANTLDNQAQFKLQSDSDIDVKVNGWYCKILLNG